MKKAKFIVFIITTLLVLSLFSFKSVNQTGLLPTRLKVLVLDGLGNPAPKAIVTLYESKDDYLNSKNAIRKDTTDQKGRVVFKSLEPKSYFIDARKGGMNNNGEGVQTAVLLEGRINKVNTVIE